MGIKTRYDHVIISPNGVGCLHCGEEQVIAFPTSISVYEAIGKAFRKDHRRCKPSEAGRRRMHPQGIYEWASCWDTGISSKTIWSVCTGSDRFEEDELGAPPQDPADFGRCCRLLALAPQWKARLGEVATKYPAWSMIVANWDTLEALYREELPTGAAPKLFAELRKLNEVSETVERLT